MGGTNFGCYAEGKTPEEAKQKAVQQAEYDYGHSGYTGTIAEKGCCKLREFELEPGQLKQMQQSANPLWVELEAVISSRELLDHPAIEDKWDGDIGFFRLGAGEEPGTERFYFFGMASS